MHRDKEFCVKNPTSETMISRVSQKTHNAERAERSGVPETGDLISKFETYLGNNAIVTFGALWLLIY
jgi:hypothetical protein